MVGLILASHGEFAQGVYQSGTMIFGAQPNVKVCVLEPSEGPDDIRQKIQEAAASMEDPQQVLILVDLWGGTPFNQALSLKEEHEDWALVTGLNLPMLIEAYACRTRMDTAHEMALHIVKSAKESVRVIPEDLTPMDEVSVVEEEKPKKKHFFLKARS